MLHQNRLARDPIAEHALTSVGRTDLAGVNRSSIRSRRIVLALRRRWGAIGHPSHLAVGRRIHANVELPVLLATGKKFGSSATRKPPEKARKDEDDTHLGLLHESPVPRELVDALLRVGANTQNPRNHIPDPLRLIPQPAGDQMATSLLPLTAPSPQTLARVARRRDSNPQPSDPKSISSPIRAIPRLLKPAKNQKTANIRSSPSSCGFVSVWHHLEAKPWACRRHQASRSIFRSLRSTTPRPAGRAHTREVNGRHLVQGPPIIKSYVPTPLK